MKHNVARSNKDTKTLNFDAVSNRQKIKKDI